MPGVLLIEDDSGVARTLVRVLGEKMRGSATVHHAATFDEGLRLLGSRARWAGLVVDVHLSANGGEGLDVLRAARLRDPEALSVVLSADRSTHTIHVAAGLGASFLPKPLPSAGALDPFVERARRRAGQLRREARIEALVSALGLTPREVDVLRAAAAGEATPAFCARAGTSPNTRKVHVKSLLRKSGDASLAALLDRVVADGSRD